MCLAFCCFKKKNAVLSLVFTNEMTSTVNIYFQLGNVRNKYDADEQAAIQHYEVRTVLKRDFEH